MERMELLLQSARLNVRIRNELLRDRESKFFTYVLQLAGSKFYVGVTDNIYTRLLDHKTLSPSSALWVRANAPVERVVEIIRNSAKDTETYKTLEFMTMFGWQNVRGASYCKVEMSGPPPSLQTFVRETREFEYMTREEIDAVCMEVSRLERELVFH